MTKKKPDADDLLSQADEPAREQLRRLGWVCCPMPGGTMWRSPSGFIFSEAEAITQVKFLFSDELNDPSRRVSG